MNTSLSIFSLVVIFTFFFTHILKAQSNEAVTRVEIRLADVLSFDAGSAAAGGLVAFDYQTVQDYNSTKIIPVPNSLMITSAKNLNVTVKAGGQYFVGSLTNAQIPVNVLIIRPVFNGTMTGTAHPIVLSDQIQTIIGNAGFGSQKTVELQYEIPKAKSSSSDMLGKPAENYVQTVTYTATAL